MTDGSTLRVLSALAAWSAISGRSGPHTSLSPSPMNSRALLTIVLLRMKYGRHVVSGWEDCQERQKKQESWKRRIGELEILSPILPVTVSPFLSSKADR